MKSLLYTILALLPLTGAAQFTFTSEYENLGTEETATLQHGKIEIVVPADQEDVTRLLYPVLDQFAEHRGNISRQEVDAILESVPLFQNGSRKFSELHGSAPTMKRSSGRSMCSRERISARW